MSKKTLTTAQEKQVERYVRRALNNAVRSFAGTIQSYQQARLIQPGWRGTAVTETPLPAKASDEVRLEIARRLQRRGLDVELRYNVGPFVRTSVTWQHLLKLLRADYK